MAFFNGGQETSVVASCRAPRPTSPSTGGGLASPGAGARPAHTRTREASPAHGTLSVADIDGAQPKRLVRAALKVPQSPPDPGMQPARFTRQRACPQPGSLHAADIPGATAGRSSWPRQRKQPLDPLAPAYQWLPIREDHTPAPKFVRDTLDVSDIVGSKELPLQGAARGLPSTMHADDIEGSKPGWRPQQLFLQPRDPLRTDICAAAAGGSGVRRGARQGSQQQRDEGSAAARAAGCRENSGSLLGSPCLTTAPFGTTFNLPPERSPPAGLMLPPTAAQKGSPPPEYGVTCTVDWQKQRAGAKLAQAEAARQASAAADAAIAAAAAAATALQSVPAAGSADGTSCASSSTGGNMNVLLRSLRLFDRDKTGRVQAVELVRALQSSGLPLSQGEAAQLAAAVRDSHNAVEYRPFVSKLYGKLRVQQAAAGGCLQAAATPDGASTAKGPPAEAAPAVHGGPPTMPQFVAARQRRLQTQVALVLNQQPGALAAEAAEVAALPGAMPPAIPWHRPAAKPFSKRMFERQEEFGGHALAFSAWEPKAAEQAALQWRASKDAQHAWAMRRENRPSKQTAAAAAARGGASSLPPTPPAAEMGTTSSLLARAQAQVAGSRPPKSAASLNREAGSPLLAAERAARAAGRREVALVRSLS